MYRSPMQSHCLPPHEAAGHDPGSTMPRPGPPLRAGAEPPASDAHSSGESGVQASPEKGACSSTILVVEDDTLVRSLFRRILQGNGYNVLEAGDGKEAVRCAQGHCGPIHLLIADINLPACNGLEVARRLGESHPETRVLIVSGYAEEVMEEMETAKAAYPLLLKPFAADTFLEKISAILGRG